MRRLATAMLVAFACGPSGCDAGDEPRGWLPPFGDSIPAPAPPPDGASLSGADARLVGVTAADHAGRAA